MRRTDTLIKVTAVIIFLAILSYIGFAFLDSRANPFKTALVSTASYEKPTDTSGWIVREEDPLFGNVGRSDGITYTVKDGEKVASGQLVAEVYVDEAARSAANEILELEQQAAALRTIISGTAGGNLAMDSIFALARGMRSGTGTPLQSLLTDVESYVTRGALSPAEAQAELDAVEARMESLHSRFENSIQGVYTPDAGVFSSQVDGFEDISFEDLEDLTPTTLDTLFSSPRKASGTCGKLISSVDWYYVCTVGESTALNLHRAESNGDTVTVRFSSQLGGDVEMDVVSIGVPQDNLCVVVLSCGKYMAEMSGTRQAQGQLIMTSLSGLRVPQDALYTDSNGDSYVYIVSGLRAKKVDVTVLVRTGDSYIVDTDCALRVGSEVITAAKDLYDGKVVR